MKKGNNFIMMSNKEVEVKQVINLYRLEKAKADEKRVRRLTWITTGLAFYAGLVISTKI